MYGIPTFRLGLAAFGLALALVACTGAQAPAPPVQEQPPGPVDPGPTVPGPTDPGPTGPPPPPVAGEEVQPGSLKVQNLDSVPYSDRLVFSRIKALDPNTPNVVHDTATVRVRNTRAAGAGALEITDFAITGPWVLDPAVPAPASIPAGGTLDVRLRFTATGGDLNSGSLTMTTTDPERPTIKIELAGFWQSQSENGQEPNFYELTKLFGYNVTVTTDNQMISNKGRVEAVGDEVLSPYWERADAGQPVRVQQLAAYHTQGVINSLSWFRKRDGVAAAVVTHDEQDGQTVLPRKLNAGSTLAAGAFEPTEVFGFKVENEFSDPAKNDQAPDVNNGCSQPCGHHLRFWPLKNRQGALVPNAFILTMDFAGINYDYNDNAYLITNIKPAGVLYRLNVGGPDFTDPSGLAWKSDKGFFSPSGAIDEVAKSQTVPIYNTVNDVLYRTYRALVPAGNPPVLTYNLPLPAGVTRVGLRLHFVELNWGGGKVKEGGVGSRVFDVEVEGALKIDNLDVYKVTGGPERALVIPIPNVTVNDGSLTIRLSASADYPTISGIEVIAE